MVVGLIGVGVVGGTLKTWFEENTDHQIRCYDPNKGMTDSLDECDAIFISIPVTAYGSGQDITALREAVDLAKKHTDFVFIRSTVLPGTSDQLKCISMPEFLTERTAYEDMKRLPVLVGDCNLNMMTRLFPKKDFVMVKNIEAELAKFCHNCFGALKVTYFNLFYKLANHLGADFENMKLASHLTGFIEKTHTQVPGHDGHFGYGGKCFPENIDAMTLFLETIKMPAEKQLFKQIKTLNDSYRKSEMGFEGAPV